MAAILEARNITKDFPGVRALENVTFTLRERQIHALCGENGAGKSTLINVLSGYFPSSSYAGEIFINTKKQMFNTILEAYDKADEAVAAFASRYRASTGENKSIVC